VTKARSSLIGVRFSGVAPAQEHVRRKEGPGVMVAVDVNNMSP
jgi:hypothetical protein